MKNKIFSIAVVALLMLATTGLASAETLNLVEKDTNTWDHVENGASVAMTYNTEGTTFDYSLSGKVTTENTQYTLMYYIDKEPTGTPESFVNPGVVGMVLGTVTSDVDKNIATDGVISVDTGSMPYDIDPNGDTNANGGYPGAKIWLVPSADIAGEGINWGNMANFLYEENLPIAENGIPSHLITYKYIEPTPEPTVEPTVTPTPTPTPIPSQTDVPAETYVCGPPTVGISANPDSLNFGSLYPGTTSNVQELTVTLTETTDNVGDCEPIDVSTTVSVTTSEWSPYADITTNVNGSPTVVVVTTTSDSAFELSATVGSEVTPGSYTQTITIDATY